MDGEDAGLSGARLTRAVISPTILQDPSLLVFFLGGVEVLSPSQRYGWMGRIMCEGCQITSVIILSW